MLFRDQNTHLIYNCVSVLKKSGILSPIKKTYIVFFLFAVRKVLYLCDNDEGMFHLLHSARRQE